MQIGTSGPRVRTWNGQLWGQEVKGQGHKRQKCVTTYSTEGVEKDASARPPYLTSTSCDLNLWRPDPQNLTVSSPCTPSKLLTPIGSKIGSFVFKCRVQKIDNECTDGWMKEWPARKHYTSAQFRLAKASKSLSARYLKKSAIRQVLTKHDRQTLW